jgi:hypothetical protein
MTWLYWLSPFSWSVRSLAVNEFTQSRYKEYETGIPGQTVNIGQLYLDTYEMRSGSEWIWNGPLLLLGYFFALSLLSIVVLTYQRYELSRGTKRFEEVEDSKNGARRTSAVPANGADDQHASSSASALPFQPVTLSFSQIHYTIVDDKGQTKKLLTNVSGYAKPKTLTALMGTRSLPPLSHRSLSARAVHCVVPRTDLMWRRCRCEWCRQNHSDGRHRRPQDSG